VQSRFDLPASLPVPPQRAGDMLPACALVRAQIRLLRHRALPYFNEYRNNLSVSTGFSATLPTQGRRYASWQGAVPGSIVRCVMISRQKLLDRAENAKGESKFIEFKRDFDTNSAQAWCEVMKDIVAFANSGGGIIVFGVDNNGTNSEADTTPILSYDSADITNRIARYTNYQFAEIEIVEVVRDKKRRAAFLITSTEVPLIFVKPGTYDIGGGKQKTAFSQGTVYFRHGSKSEPGTRDDLLKWRDRELARVRKTWLGGLRKVVEASSDEVFTVISSRSPQPKEGMIVEAKMSADPSAVNVFPSNAETVWPYRQKDVISAVNEKIGKGARINSHDIACINWKFEILKKHPKFAYKSHRFASALYSLDFVNWIVDQFKKNEGFFQNLRTEYRENSK
jgi:hypothetical protein